MNKKRIFWRLCVAAAIIVCGLSFTPLAIPAGQHQPWLFGMPYSLWMGILLTILMVVLTWLGSKVHPGTYNTEDHD
ncbi:MAG: hypothetical protein OEX02_03415 [Cyclobacteriaceae bacterium]|nr:hypothetical protein [Cyclobacteriaceae bacterium]